MPTLTNPAPGTLPRLRYWVEASSTINGSYTYLPYLQPLRCVEACAPEIGSADLLYHFGYIKREDQASAAYFTPYNLLGAFVAIWCQEAGYAPQLVWRGIVTDVENRLERADVPGGAQLVKAWGLAHLLEKMEISTAKVLKSTSLVTIDWVPTFNRRTRLGLSLTGNRSSGFVDGSSYVFSEDNETWTSADVLQYLLTYHVPDAITVTVSGQLDVLEKLIEEYQFEGMSTWAAINKIIDRKRGLGCYVKAGSLGNSLELVIFTLVERDLTYGTKSLPANPNQTYFQMPSEYPWTHLVPTIPFRSTTTNQYDVIEVRGERLRVTGTFSIRDENLVEAWSDDLESDYVTGLDPDDEEQNDRYRSLDKFEGVFTRFVVPKDWDGQCGNGEGEDRSNVLLDANDDGTVTHESVGGFFPADKTFLRQLPFEVGKDYQDGAEDAPDDNPDGVEPEFKLLFAVIEDKTEGATIEGRVHEETDKWHYLDRLSESFREESIRSASARPLSTGFGVEISASPRHYFAMANEDFGYSGAGASSIEAEFDYQKLAFTCQFEHDIRPRVVVENVAGTPSTTERKLVIDVPGAESWWVATGTILDVDDKGKPVRYKGSDNLVRDDSEKLQAVAAFASGWYGVTRQAVNIVINSVGLFCQLGVLITDIRTSSMTEPVRTVVTARSIDFDAQQTTIETGYANFDLGFVQESRKLKRRGRR